MRTNTKPVICCCIAILASAMCLADAAAQDSGRGARLFQQLDRNGDGRITSAELQSARVFEALDGNGDGAITADEARAAVAKMTPENRRKLAAAIQDASRKVESEKEGLKPPDKPQPTDYRASYSKNLKIHVGVLGESDGEPLTTGDDFKPSWSKTGDMLVFFRRLKKAPSVGNWKTAICIINVDGSGFHQLTDGTHTDFNPTWTRDGANTPIWNRKNPATGRYCVKAGKVGGKPGDEIALTDSRYPSWAYTCLSDGRILVGSAPPKLGRGYYLMTPNPGGEPKFERIDCELATKGILDRVSVSPSETKVCFEYQKGFLHKMSGRTLYVADFDADKGTIRNAKPFANEEGKPVWFAYPRWTKDEAAIIYHAGGKLYLYTLEDGSTRKVSTDDGANYMYPHGEATPK
jgi:hypothetical protein